MKIIIATMVVGMLLVAGTAEATKKLLRGDEFATAGLGAKEVKVYKIPDGDVTCYVTVQGSFGAHAISCVK